MKLLVIHKTKTSWPYARLWYIIHKFDACLEIMEKDWLIYLFLRNWSNFYDALGNNTKVTLMTKDKFMDIRSRTNSRSELAFLKCTNRGCYLDSDNNIINISISIFFHAWSTGTNPTSQRAELNWIWLMSTHHSVFWQLFFHIFSDNSCFYASHHIIFIDPSNFIHASTINRNDSTGLFCLTHKWFGDICSTSKGNKDNIVTFSCSNKILCLLMRCYIDNIINCSVKLWCSEQK